ncbi:peroxiredoxin [Solidesulfovibrio magneticus]|jgi:peroxiredoxin (alkyl hydroperoxide reductase subunit C)|uniref:Alkyl hydroperoxide reductase C n=1 Tax=Solidesulfovibrio magneticus (strain ATCC 700980 / DSM 13731 / RS-1) TaxID=573370 RepID=C4XJ97_SOLM1|nr:redoxin domain-containing protein [Solidesulfovibrio magneticus]BAH74261.1 alkyl hydroperoxide reductase subunit C [Solidesulfovibrio magneticus RS-1]
MHDHDHEEYDECCTEIPEASVGQPVVDFSLKVYDPEEGFFGEMDMEKLMEDGKWVILFFYPADFTFVCPTELADLAAKHEELKKLGFEVFSVSTDTEFAHLAWRNSERLLENVKYKMAADPTGKVSRYFGVYDEESGLALRGTFIINPDGVLVSKEINFYNVGRNADELLRKCQANVYLREHPAEACPAKWTPGDKTLTPSEQLVGKVYEALS